MSQVFIIDLTGLSLSQAVLKTRDILAEGQPGPLALSMDRESSALELAAILETSGLATRIYRQGSARLVLGQELDSPEILVWHDAEGWRAMADDEEEDAEEIIDLLQPAADAFEPDAEADSSSGEPGAPNSTLEEVAVLVGSRFMGSGNDELGAKLTQSFFDSLAAPGQVPAFLAFYNTGVFLTTGESAVVEALRDMAARGSTIISSGVCLDFFNLQDQLKVGRIGNMYEIIKAQRHFARVLRL